MKQRNDIGDALSRVYAITKNQAGNIIRSNQMLRKDREILVATKWLQEIMNGWYLLVRPELKSGDSSAWYANFWDFLRLYLEYHYEQEYCLSVENSLDLHVCSSLIPKQVLVMAKGGSGKIQELPFDTSLLVASRQIPEERTHLRGLQVVSLPYALCKAPLSYFQKNPQEAEIALNLVPSHHDLVYMIGKYNFQQASERLIGAYKHMGNEEMAHLLESALHSIGLRPKAIDPFADLPPLIPVRVKSPYAGRILALWTEYREQIIKICPRTLATLPKESDYLLQVESLYVKDAYNSLSIEGYQVNEELVERVMNNEWNPELHPEDMREQNALAARGYYEAHIQVKESIHSIFQGANPGDVVKKDLTKWYEKLFSPMVAAGIIQKIDLIGYRKGQVYIRESRHTPLPKEALLDAMDTLFTCLREETHPFVRAVLGHYIFVYIHPYMDGNGRIGRFLMNVMFSSGGYPWTVVQVKNRAKYIESLEKIHTEHTVEPFTKLIIQEMNQSFA